MIVNLLDNAVRHTPAGTTVRVDPDETDTGYAIAVRDQGPGIPPEIRPHIFERSAPSLAWHGWPYAPRRSR